MDLQQIVNRLYAFEAMAESMRKEATVIRKKLEGFNSPTPERGGRKKVLSLTQEGKLKSKMREKILKKVI